MASVALASGFPDDPSPRHACFRVIAFIEADASPTSPLPALRRATDTPPTSPRPAEITCAVIEANVFAKLGWAPPSGSAQECAEAATVIGYASGLASQITCPE
jgi:hypothetical protein